MELNILTGVLGYAVLLTTLNVVLYFFPLSCILGMVQGVCCWKSGYGQTNLILSIIGLLFVAVVSVFLMSVTV